MSYVLDALRRSQAERERGQVPGLHGQQAPLATEAPPAPRTALRRWALAALLCAVLAAVAWVLWQRREAVAVVPAPAPAPVVAPPAPAVPLPVVVSAPPVVAAAKPAPPPLSVPSAPAAAPRVLRLSELSAEQRRELPPLVLSGSIWSDNKASRFVIVNGLVVHEGEAAAPGVTLESLAPKAARLRWRDLLIELPL